TGALLAIFVFAPISVVTFAWLYRIGVPADIVRDMGYWKEMLVVGLVVAALRHGLRHGHRLDTVDKVAIAYVIGTALYLLIPDLFLRGFPAGDFNARATAWRNLVLFPTLFVAVRHGPFDANTKRKAAVAVLIGGAFLAAGAFWEFFWSDSFNRFAI